MTELSCLHWYIKIMLLYYYAESEWIAETTKENKPDPLEPRDIEEFMRTDKRQYTEFTNKMVRAVHGKS